MNRFVPYSTFLFFNSYPRIRFSLGRNGSLKPSQTKKEKNKKKKYHHNTCHSLSEWCVCFNEPFLRIFKIPNSSKNMFGITLYTLKHLIHIHHSFKSYTSSAFFSAT